MKTTIEIPDPLFRKAKSRAAERGQTLKEFGFGSLRRLRKEAARIQGVIDEEFERIEPEDRL